ncbi:23S rRNA (uridine(2552)-2'-O)-methyltransferase [Halobacteriales archaeon QS_8_69_73]|nr:MAG: 23S rRNA (uridine(2552)-2'-O)-methyltransferase [Halobacteriales archaeon QS_8_69_73]
MAGKDEYYNRAKQEGYRSRAAYKLKQLDETADLIADGDTVVDLGAAPGGWLQVATELAGTGTVVGVDRQRIDPVDVTGEYELDHARSVHLARTAFETALELLAPGGDFVAKVFEGPDTDNLRNEVEVEFEYARTIHPDASRDSSSELYLVGKGRVTAPVAEGDRLEVDVVDEGDEGDGIAKVDGYTLFVPGADAGETVEARVTDVKPRFGFAEPVD